MCLNDMYPEGHYDLATSSNGYITSYDKVSKCFPPNPKATDLWELSIMTPRSESKKTLWIWCRIDSPGPKWQAHFAFIRHDWQEMLHVQAAELKNVISSKSVVLENTDLLVHEGKAKDCELLFWLGRKSKSRLTASRMQSHRFTTRVIGKKYFPCYSFRVKIQSN